MQRECWIDGAAAAAGQGWDGKLTDWLYGLTKDCPRKQSPG